MSTFAEIISRVDECRPNAFPESAKFRWLTQLEGKIAADVLLLDISEIRALPHSYPEDVEKETLVDYPHDDVYDAWLKAMIDLENGEYSKYQNSMEFYNEVYRNFVLWFARRYEPAQGGPGLPGYFITAYGMAVQAGYQGSVEEWLVSLIGPQGPQGIQGETGKSAYEYAVAGGYEGTEENFAERMAFSGKTAYEYAVEGGYTGTAEEFAEKLAKEYAMKDHDHDEDYAPKDHDHDEDYAPKNHDHDKKYAPASHGNHVPEPETANNTKFLRNDNTWQTVKPKNIGALATDGSNAMAAAFNAGGFRVTNVAAPTSNNDAVPKAYVDNGFSKSGHDHDEDYAPKPSKGEYLNSVVTYYGTAMSADDLLVPTALIPVGPTANSELYSIVGGSFAYVITLFYTSVSTTRSRVQIGLSYNTVPAKMAVRVYGSNGWTAWKHPGFDENETYHALFRTIGGVEQYLNPVMALGTEYCTLERYKGKPVYTKLINLGTLPDSTTKTVAHGLSGVTVVRYQAFADNGSLVQEFPFHNTAGAIVGKVYYSPDGVKVITYDDLSAYAGTVQLWYTK